MAIQSDTLWPNRNKINVITFFYHDPEPKGILISDPCTRIITQIPMLSNCWRCPQIVFSSKPNPRPAFASGMHLEPGKKKKKKMKKLCTFTSNFFLSKNIQHRLSILGRIPTNSPEAIVLHVNATSTEYCKCACWQNSSSWPTLLHNQFSSGDDSGRFLQLLSAAVEFGS